MEPVGTWERRMQARNSGMRGAQCLVCTAAAARTADRISMAALWAGA